MAKIGSSYNSKINGEWAKHIRKGNGDKRLSHKKHRAIEKELIHKELNEK